MVRGRITQNNVKESKSRISFLNRKNSSIKFVFLHSDTLEVIIVGRHHIKSYIGPECQRCCCWMSTSYDSGTSQRTFMSLKKFILQPLRCAQTAMSISSTVVLSSQPPDSTKAFILQTLAIPLKPEKCWNSPLTCYSTSK